MLPLCDRVTAGRVTVPIAGKTGWVGPPVRPSAPERERQGVTVPRANVCWAQVVADGLSVAVRATRARGDASPPSVAALHRERAFPRLTDVVTSGVPRTDATRSFQADEIGAQQEGRT